MGPGFPPVSPAIPCTTIDDHTSLVLFRPVGVPSRRTFVCWHEPSLRKAAPKWMLLNGLLIWCEAHKLPFLVELKTSKRSKLANDKGWSLMNLPVKCHFSNHKFDIQWFFQGNALSMFLMQLLNIFCLRVWSIRCDRRKDCHENFQDFRAIPHSNGTKAWFCPLMMCTCAHCFNVNKH